MVQTFGSTQDESIWTACNGDQQLSSISGRLCRLVESQEQVATLGYVDNLAEQALLESLLDSTKAPYPAGLETYHYLLKTPFRYPPLRHGSRFGRVHEPSLFYGGLDVATTLAESAYYRFVFWSSMAAPAPKPFIRSEHTLFFVRYKTSSGIKLQASPFSAYQRDLTHPSNYSVTQILGSEMRAANVLAFEYVSARAPANAGCVALFSPKAFVEKKPTNLSKWLCEISANEVAFKQVGNAEVHRFSREHFVVNNIFPQPA